MGLFHDRTKTDGKTGVPVWFMRQAGRYHSHYQKIKAESDFMTMCKNPDLACEVTMGPIEDFNFDAAILFSDLLFPLEQLGMGLSYHSGPPTLELSIGSIKEIESLKLIAPAAKFYQFQKDALAKLKQRLPKDKSLLGFVGAPFTLYAYAAEGAHSGGLTETKKGLYDGRFHAFMERLLPELIENMKIQAEGGADHLCLFDTAAGELSLMDFKRFLLPSLKKVTAAFKKAYPNKKIIYYSKFTNLSYLESIEDENIDVLGIDWRVNLSDALLRLSNNYYIQGNIDPAWLHLSWNDLEFNLRFFLSELTRKGVNFDRWVMGLGHGVMIKTPEENVKKAVELIHSEFRY